MNRPHRILAAALIFAATAAPLQAQEPSSLAAAPSTRSLAALGAARILPADLDAPATSPASSTLPLPKYGGWVGVTKWATLVAATGLGTLGFLLHKDASDTFDRLERACSADPDTCRELNPDGSYADPQLERLYQDVVDRDNQARVSLIAAEVSFGLSVLLFIADFQKERGPSDIPYDPDEGDRKLELSVRPGELGVKYYLN